MPLEERRVYRWAAGLWPEVETMDGPRRQEAVATVGQMLILSPFAVWALTWLAVRTDYSRLEEHLLALLVLFGAMLLLLVQPFNVQVRLGRAMSELKITASLAPLVMWSTLFVSGAAGMWALVLATIVAALWQGWKLARYGQNPVWGPLSAFVQQISLYLLATLFTANLYLNAGGAFPITLEVRADWFLAILCIIAGVLLTGLLTVPVAILVDRLNDRRTTLTTLMVSYAGAVALPLVMCPFSIIIALLNIEGRELALVFILVGVYLVNRLAHHMSKSNDRSRRQANEFAQLEAMGQAIIEAPTDASTLPAILETYLPRLFPVETVAVHLFPDGEHRSWAPFDVTIRPDAMPGADAIWAELQRSSEAQVVYPKTTPPGSRIVYGDGLAIKINKEQAGAKSKTTASCVGGVYLLRHNAVGKTMDSQATMHSLASQIASALYRAEAQAEFLAFQKAQQELEFAGRIQHSFLPTNVPEPDSWQISATLDSARQTSGDFYDFIPVGDGLIGVVVADVSDKGTGAALYMALSRTLIRTYAMESGLQPGAALRRANERILEDTETDQFVTGFYGILDVRTGTLTYANAGHNPGYLLRAGSEVVESLGHTGIPLGMFGGMNWKQAEAQIEAGDLLLLYTDGVPEAQNAGFEEFSEARFLAAVVANRGRSAEAIQQAVIDELKAFVGNAPQFDDITLMVILRER